MTFKSLIYNIKRPNHFLFIPKSFKIKLYFQLMWKELLLHGKINFMHYNNWKVIEIQIHSHNVCNLAHNTHFCFTHVKVLCIFEDNVRDTDLWRGNEACIAGAELSELWGHSVVCSWLKQGLSTLSQRIKCFLFTCNFFLYSLKYRRLSFANSGICI